MIASRNGVDLQELLAGYGQGGLITHHLPLHAQVVRDIVLIKNVEEIRTVGPDSMLLLGDELSLGGWIVSVALRYAWERRAAAVVVADASFSDTVVELASRFGVALLSSSQGIDHTALALARRLGALDAGMLRRLDSLHERLIACTTVESALGELSRDLSGAYVAVMVAGSPVTEVGTAASDAPELRRQLRGEQELIARVPRAQQEFATLALARASVIVRSMLLAQEMDDVTAASPLLSFAVLTGMRSNAVDSNAPLPVTPPRGWRAGTPLLAVVAHAVNGEEGANRIAPLVHARWRHEFPRAPLVRMQTGWFSLLPIPSSYDGAELGIAKLARADLGTLGVAVGFSHTGDGGPGAGYEDEIPRLLRRAWLAARYATPRDGAVEFSAMGKPLLHRLLQPDEAQELVALTFPRLLADPNVTDLIRTIVAYLDCAGSITAAAAALGIHRNTIQLRLRHCAELGVRLDDPERLLSTHLMLSALDVATLTTRPSST